MTAIERRCEFSPCRRWRYTLWREWPSLFTLPTGHELPQSQCRMTAGLPPYRTDAGPPYLMVIGLNPSTADERQDDPTIRRCISFAKRWGFGALCMTNLFAWRDTDPEAMKRVPDPVGPENDQWLSRASEGAGLILAAWGTHGTRRQRDRDAMDALVSAWHKLHALKTNTDGTPSHPLYIPANTVPASFTPPQNSPLDNPPRPRLPNTLPPSAVREVRPPAARRSEELRNTTKSSAAKPPPLASATPRPAPRV
jgi:hypothetical protein